MAGPLYGTRIIEFAGIGPGPFCGMMLSDMGAEVIRIDRTDSAQPRGKDGLSRGRRSIALNLKSPLAVEVALKLCESAEAVFEGFRPGVMERLGLGPDVCLKRKPTLVYGRMTGWGQDGPLAQAAGHDPNYIALAGVLHTIGRRNEPPTLPLNLIGDFGGGGLLLAFGLVCGILEARSSGKGQVIDAAMVDGAATLATLIYALKAQGRYVDERESNFLDGGAHFNQVYETSDGKHVSICSLEPQFYDELVQKLDLDRVEFARQMDRDAWPAYRERLTTLFKQKTRAEWCEILEGSDVCFAPVLSLTEAPNHPHNRARGTFVEHDGFIQPAPAPRFSRTPGSIQSPSRPAGADSEALLAELGLSSNEIRELDKAGAMQQARPVAQSD